jgi:hypothetical protein
MPIPRTPGDDCGTCKYLGWHGQLRYCRHPDHVAIIKSWPHNCDDWLHIDEKFVGSYTFRLPVRLNDE